MTIEFWAKDLKTPTSSDNTSVLFETFDGASVLSQIAIVTNSSNLNQRSIRVVSNVSGGKTSTPSMIEWKTTNKTLGFWLHFSVVSNGNSLSMTIYNYTSKAQSTFNQAGI